MSTKGESSGRLSSEAAQKEANIIHDLAGSRAFERGDLDPVPEDYSIVSNDLDRFKERVDKDVDDFLAFIVDGIKLMNRFSDEQVMAVSMVSDELFPDLFDPQQESTSRITNLGEQFKNGEVSEEEFFEEASRLVVQKLTTLEAFIKADERVNKAFPDEEKVLLDEVINYMKTKMIAAFRSLL